MWLILSIVGVLVVGGLLAHAFGKAAADADEQMERYYAAMKERQEKEDAEFVEYILSIGGRESGLHDWNFDSVGHACRRCGLSLDEAANEPCSPFDAEVDAVLVVPRTLQTPFSDDAVEEPVYCCWFCSERTRVCMRGRWVCSNCLAYLNSGKSESELHMLLSKKVSMQIASEEFFLQQRKNFLADMDAEGLVEREILDVDPTSAEDLWPPRP